MSSAQDRVILLSSVVVESVWIYAAMSVLGLAIGLGGSPVSWIAAVSLMLVSFFVSRTMMMIILPVWTPYVVEIVVGVIAVYLTLGTQLQTSGGFLDMGWIGTLGSVDRPDDILRRAAIGGFYAVLFWWRGGRLASTDFPAEHLSFVFRIGLIVLSLVAIVDIFNAADLKIFPLMFAFFAAGLAGLSIGHILPASGEGDSQRRWARVIGLVVGAVVTVGMVFSLLQGWVLNLLSTPITWVLKGVATVIIYVVLTPILFVLGYIASFLYDLLLRVMGPPAQPVSERTFSPQGMLDELRDQANTGDTSIWLDVLVWTFIALLVAALLWMIASAFRRRARWRRVEQGGDRESLEDFDIAVDLARLLFGLLPERFRRRRADTRLRLPDDDPGIVDVFRIYFGMLNIADSKGVGRRPDQTPDEYRSSLAQIFPDGLVRMATRAFNRACYGRRAASRDDITEMRQALERAADGD